MQNKFKFSLLTLSVSSILPQIAFSKNNLSEIGDWTYPGKEPSTQIYYGLYEKKYTDETVTSNNANITLNENKVTNNIYTGGHTLPEKITEKYDTSRYLTLYAGYASNNKENAHAEASNNTFNITGTILGKNDNFDRRYFIVAGKSEAENAVASNNTVNIDDAVFDKGIYTTIIAGDTTDRTGGSDNTVMLPIKKSLKTSSATNNTINVKNSNIDHLRLIGGYGLYANENNVNISNVSGNITIDGGLGISNDFSIKDYVGQQSTANNNKVILDNAKIDTIYVGKADKQANGNILQLDNSITKRLIYVGYADGGFSGYDITEEQKKYNESVTANNNRATINNSELDYITVAEAGYGTANSNKLDINNSTIGKFVVAKSMKEASDNQVNITNNSVISPTGGSGAYSSLIKNNVVNIDNSTVNGIQAAFGTSVKKRDPDDPSKYKKSADGYVENNQLTVTNNSKIFGSITAASDATVKDNQLKISDSTLTGNKYSVQNTDGTLSEQIKFEGNVIAVRNSDNVNNSQLLIQNSTVNAKDTIASVYSPLASELVNSRKYKDISLTIDNSEVYARNIYGIYGVTYYKEKDNNQYLDVNIENNNVDIKNSTVRDTDIKAVSATAGNIKGTKLNISNTEFSTKRNNYITVVDGLTHLLGVNYIPASSSIGNELNITDSTFKKLASDDGKSTYSYKISAITGVADAKNNIANLTNVNFAGKYPTPDSSNGISGHSTDISFIQSYEIADSNTLNIEGGEYQASINAVSGENIQNNTFNITDAAITGHIYGFSSECSNKANCTISNNQLNISNAQIVGDIYGTHSDNLNVDNNKININGGKYDGNIYLNYSHFAEADTTTENNSITISGETEITGTIFGIKKYYSNQTTKNNSFNFGSSNSPAAMNKVKVGKLKNLDTYNFYLPSDIKDGDIAVQVTGEEAVNLSGAAVNAYIHTGTKNMNAGDAVHLLATTTGVTKDYASATVYRGLEQTTDAAISVEGNNLDLTWKTTPDPDPTVDPQPQPDPVKPQTPTLTAANGKFTGKTTPLATVEIKDPSGKVIATATADADGSYSADIPEGAASGNYTATAKLNNEVSDAGQGSYTAPQPVTPDPVVTPSKPDTPKNISIKDNTVTGTTTPGATVKITDANGNVVATATADANGNFGATLDDNTASGALQITAEKDGESSQQATAQYSAPQPVTPAVPVTPPAAQNPTFVINPNTKSLLETRIAQTALVNEGSDLVSDFARNKNADNSGVSAFVTTAGHGKRYKSGSHVDANGLNLAVGVLADAPHDTGVATVGVYLEHGKSDYDSHLDNGVRADGDANYLGVGLYAKEKINSGFYVDGSLRAGKVKADYESNDLIPVANTTFETKNTYIGGHIGVGQEIQLGSNNNLDIYGNIAQTHTKGGNTTVDIHTPVGLDQATVHFDSVNSTRVKVGARDSIRLNDNSSLFVGAAYQYEFKNTANGQFLGTEIAAPSLKGSSGQAEFGYKYAGEQLEFRAGVKGSVGKERGVSGNIGVRYNFK